VQHRPPLRRILFSSAPYSASSKIENGPALDDALGLSAVLHRFPERSSQASASYSPARCHPADLPVKAIIQSGSSSGAKRRYRPRTIARVFFVRFSANESNASLPVSRSRSHRALRSGSTSPAAGSAVYARNGQASSHSSPNGYSSTSLMAAYRQTARNRPLPVDSPSLKSGARSRLFSAKISCSAGHHYGG